MKVLISFFFMTASLMACAAPQKLTCYDEIGRKSTIIEYDLAKPDAIIKESGDEFLCEPGMDIYCTTTAGKLEVSSSSLIVTWTRELSGEESVYDINREDLNYMGEFAGALWQGRCEAN